MSGAANTNNKGSFMYAMQMTGRQTLEVLVSFDGAIVGAHHLHKGQSLRVGPADSLPDYPVEGMAAPLCCAGFGETMTVVFPQGATGSVTLADGSERTVALLCAEGLCEAVEGGQRYALPEGARAAFQVGSLQLIVSAALLLEKPLPRRAPMDWRSHRFVAASLLLHGTVMGLAILAPPDQRALASQDLNRLSNRELTRLIPVVSEVKPLPLPVLAAGGQGGALSPRGPAGRVGNEHSVRRTFARSPQPQPTTMRGGYDLKAEVRNTGLLALLDDKKKGPLAQVFDSSKSALGDESQSILSALPGTTLEDGWGPGGGDIVGTDRGGHCTGPSCGTVAVSLDRVCTGANCGNGPRGPGGHGPGGLPALSHHPEGPTVNFDTPPVIVGGLDRDTVRRVIRSQMNQFRHCYEKELLRSPELSGRVVVSFIIGKDGRVISAAAQQSTLGSPAVAQCVSGAVQRLSFPQPAKTAQLVQVSYPFMFHTAGQ